ncbi:MAG: VOC family protein [Candidatus Odinarchaeota archaeon]
MMIKNVSCVEIPVADMQRAVAFYEKILKLNKTYEHPVWTAFSLGGTTFALAASGTKNQMEKDEICKSCALCVHRLVAGGVYAHYADLSEAFCVSYMKYQIG